MGDTYIGVVSSCDVVPGMQGCCDPRGVAIHVATWTWVWNPPGLVCARHMTIGYMASSREGEPGV